jgi:hypothetical protein
MITLKPPDFLRTIYVGDRACRAIHIESWKTQVALEVDVISRIRSPSGNWEHYSAEDIPGGRIVFSGVETLQLDPSGPLPNCVFRAMPNSHSGPSRTPVPEHAEHRFRAKPNTHSGLIDHPGGAQVGTG